MRKTNWQVYARSGTLAMHIRHYVAARMRVPKLVCRVLTPAIGLARQHSTSENELCLHACHIARTWGPSLLQAYIFAQVDAELKQD